MSTEVFQYPEGVTETIKEENFNRLGCWFTILLPFIAITVFLIKDPKDAHEALVALLATLEIILIMIAFDICLRRCGKKTCLLSDHEIRLAQDNKLTQIDGKNITLALIDLTKPFKVKFNYYVTGNAIYTVTQKDEFKNVTSLQFSSRIRNAERLVKDILKTEWHINS